MEMDIAGHQNFIRAQVVNRPTPSLVKSGSTYVNNCWIDRRTVSTFGLAPLSIEPSLALDPLSANSIPNVKYDPLADYPKIRHSVAGRDGLTEYLQGTHARRATRSEFLADLEPAK
jgi:hypothetical protein